MSGTLRPIDSVILTALRGADLRRRVATLTGDDGLSPATLRLLDTLLELNAPPLLFAALAANARAAATNVRALGAQMAAARYQVLADLLDAEAAARQPVTGTVYALTPQETPRG